MQAIYEKNLKKYSKQSYETNMSFDNYPIIYNNDLVNCVTFGEDSNKRPFVSIRCQITTKSGKILNCFQTFIDMYGMSNNIFKPRGDPLIWYGSNITSNNVKLILKPNMYITIFQAQFIDKLINNGIITFDPSYDLSLYNFDECFKNDMPIRIDLGSWQKN